MVTYSGDVNLCKSPDRGGGRDLTDFLLKEGLGAFTILLFSELS